MRYTVRALTDVGRVRDGNEDSFYVSSSEDPNLIAVADGMGGHEGGEVASSLALEVLSSWRERIADRGGEALKDAVLDANTAVWSKGKADPQLAHMGTTLTAAWLDDDRATVAHVGDSRAYLLRGNTLEQLTTDQTHVQLLVDEGTITAEEATRHPQRSYLLQAVGSEPNVRVDTFSVELHAGDRMLLASDGLFGLVSDSRLKEILTANVDADEACRVLIDAANEAGGQDNITAVLLDVHSEDGAAPAVDTGGQVIIEKPAPAASQRSARKIPAKVIAIAGLAAIALIAVVLLLNTAKTASTKFLVASGPDGNVVIMKGTPGTAQKPPTGEIVEPTDVQVASLPATYQRDLKAGIPVDTLEEAKKVIASIPRVLGPQDTPSPVPVTPSPPPIGPGTPAP